MQKIPQAQFLVPRAYHLKIVNNFILKLAIHKWMGDRPHIRFLLQVSPLFMVTAPVTANGMRVWAQEALT